MQKIALSTLASRKIRPDYPIRSKRKGAAVSESIRKFYDTLDKKVYIRITVLLLPGIILGSLAARFNLPSELKTASSVLLLVGGGLFVGWRYVSSYVERMANGDDQGEEGGDSEEEEWLPPATMAELVALCGNDQARAMLAILVEREIFPDLTTDECIAMAALRKRVEARLSVPSTPASTHAPAEPT